MTPTPLDLPSGATVFRRLVLDFTGTLSLDGSLLPGVGRRLAELARELEITVLTADTFGTAREAVAGLPVEVTIIRDGAEKADLVSRMEPDTVITIGNGRNDVAMMMVSGLAIAVLGPEGAAADLLRVAHVVTRDINDALDLILNPLRLKATLRE